MQLYSLSLHKYCGTNEILFFTDQIIWGMMKRQWEGEKKLEGPGERKQMTLYLKYEIQVCKSSGSRLSTKRTYGGRDLISRHRFALYKS